jgi:hypothetical protein
VEANAQPAAHSDVADLLTEQPHIRLRRYLSKVHPLSGKGGISITCVSHLILQHIQEQLLRIGDASEESQREVKTA